METTPIHDNQNLNENPSLKEINIKINSSIILEIGINKNFSDLPFICFQDTNASSIEDLNFNALKKCKLNEINKYMIIFLGQFENTNHTFHGAKKYFNTWHNTNPSVKLELTTCDTKFVSIDGQMLKIFHKHYQPTINNSNP